MWLLIQLMRALIFYWNLEGTLLSHIHGRANTSMLNNNTAVSSSASPVFFFRLDVLTYAGYFLNMKGYRPENQPSVTVSLYHQTCQRKSEKLHSGKKVGFVFTKMSKQPIAEVVQPSVVFSVEMPLLFLGQ